MCFWRNFKKSSEITRHYVKSRIEKIFRNDCSGDYLIPFLIYSIFLFMCLSLPATESLSFKLMNILILQNLLIFL